MRRDDAVALKYKEQFGEERISRVRDRDDFRQPLFCSELSPIGRFLARSCDTVHAIYFGGHSLAAFMGIRACPYSVVVASQLFSLRRYRVHEEKRLTASEAMPRFSIR